MKKMKRILMWLLVVTMMYSMIGCAKEPTPEEVYIAAFEKVNALTDLDTEMDMTLVMAVQGETMEMGVEAALLMENPQSEGMKLAMDMKMDMLGNSIDLTSYYADGYYLMELLGQKIKYKMPMEEAMDQAVMMQEVAIDLLSEITMTEENGVRILQYTVDTSKMMGEYMEDYMATLGMTGLEENVTYENIVGTMKVNEEGYPTEVTMEMAFTTETEGVLIDCDVMMEMVYNDPGHPVTVEIPDVSEYIEVDPEIMS